MFEKIIKGWVGELRTQFAQKLFLDNKQYYVFNNLIIPSGSRTTQIDHVVVSRYGVFVVETKHKEGWIFGDVKQASWTQVIFKNKYQFQNPLRQNYLHTKSIAEYLRIPHNKIHSVVVFWGNCKFKTKMPENVLHNHYTDYIKNKDEIILTDIEVEKICSKLKQVKENMGLLSGWKHAQQTKKRFHNR